MSSCLSSEHVRLLRLLHTVERGGDEFAEVTLKLTSILVKGAKRLAFAEIVECIDQLWLVSVS